MQARKSLMKKIFAVLVTAVLFTVGFATTHAGIDGSVKYNDALASQLNLVNAATPMEVVIVFNDASAATQVENIAADFIMMSELNMAGALLTANQIDQVAALSGVDSITLNEELEYFLHESVELINAPEIWNTYGQRGGNPTVTVAVIDSGIDGAHPDLLYGQKVLQNVKMTALGPGVENVVTTDNTSGHGTHVAGTIGGLGTMSDGYHTGVAPDVGLIGLGSGEAISILTAVQSYNWVLENHEQYDIRIVSNSWGTTGGDVDIENPVNLASYEAYQRGILSVFAAGNDGGYDVMNPYSIVPWVISVAAGDKSYNLAGFSSRGVDGDFYKHPDITAPGVDIYAARCSCVGVTATSVVNPVNPAWTAHYAALDGTSMATPHVSGVAALLLSQNPQLSPDQLMDIMYTTTTPMLDYSLFEVGYGYLDALAAFEESLNVQGNLNAFLAGDRDQSLELVLGVDVDSLVYDTVSYTAYSAAGATTMPANEYPIPVEDAVIVSVDLTWTPAEEDAYDLEVVDGAGNVVASSGNSVGEGESVLFVPETSETHTLRVIPFAGINAQYTATVTTGYGELLENWPPHQEAQFDFIFSITNLYKSAGVVGLAGGNYFKGGDSGFVVLSFTPTEGPTGGDAADLKAIFTDSQGDIFVSDITESADTPGEYRVNFSLDGNWPLAPGETTIDFIYTGDGAVRPAEQLNFFFNHLETTLDTDNSDYYPGDTVGFSGTVTAFNTIAVENVEMTPTSADVAVSLVDSDGNVLATETVTADMDGNYSGSVVSPASTRGVVTVVAEATYEDPTVLLGEASQYGVSEATIIFPGNLAPEVSLSAATTVTKHGHPMAHMHVVVTDPDGFNDIDRIYVRIHDADGRLIRLYREHRFTPINGEWLFTKSAWLAGDAPWTLSVTASDSAGNETVIAETLTLD